MIETVEMDGTVTTLVSIDERLAGAPDANFDDIEWRIDSAPYERQESPTGWVARWVPYLKAPSVARMLDEWVGPGAWSDVYVPLGAGKGLECHLTILGVTKIDVGVPPSGDDNLSVKGVYSDAFKRVASIKWGVGRNIYRLEGVWAPVRVRDRDGKKQALEAPESIESIRRQYDEQVG
jgi:hypothetical protein